MTDNTETELRIHSSQPGVDLVGILHRKTSSSSNPPKRIALILHGLLAHKNQSYHRALAQALPIDSYRFDFRGNGESKGDWTMGNLDNDIRDLSSVVHHLHHNEGYAVDLIVAHSRGTMVSWIYLSRSEEELSNDLGKQAYIPNLVGVSGRWHMAKALETYARFQEGFDKEGFYRWQITSAGQKREYIVWPHDLQHMSQFKNPAEMVARLNVDTDVLVLHGTADSIVHHHDAHCFLDALEANKHRRRDSHRLQLVEGADHMYRGRTQPVVDYICGWYAERGNRGGVADAATASTSRL